MLKLFLVEDEIVVREGISKNIDWRGNGFDFVGEACDGELGYPLIKKLQPDILIADIKMPFMDGLELSRLVKSEMPWVKIIILTGYDEFSYAKQAIDIGVTSYLLKPFSGQKLLEAVQQVAKIILEEKEQKEIVERYKKERMDFEQLEQSTFFEDLVSRRLPVCDTIERGRKLALELTANCYNIVLFKVFCQGVEEDKSYCEDTVAAGNELLELFWGMEHVLVFNRNTEGYALLLKGESIHAVKQLAADCAKGLQGIVAGYEELAYFAGIGEPVVRLSELAKCFEGANRAFAFRYILGENQVAYADQSPIGLPGQPLDISFTSINASKLDKKTIERFLRSGSQQAADPFIDDYLDSINFLKIESYLFRQYITIDIHIAILAFIEELGYSKTEFVSSCGDISKNLQILNSAQQTKDYLKTMLRKAIAIRDSISGKKYSSVLQLATEYIAQNYNNQELSLNTVAASVNISPNHFSTIFHQELGQTFIAYLTELRMQKAKELLRCSSMKAAEIAYAVGYKDAHYFSYLFKKMQGCTPMEFRARKE